MSTSTSNKLVRSLQKLPENKRCFNCEVLGTNFIVPAFGIFVCTDCSGLHMKCGQRVKSISLGNYTSEEAKTLQDGGNEKAAHVYLAKWSPNTSIQKPIDKKPPKVEEWIRTIFISKQYYSEEAAREVEVRTTVEDKPLKPGVKLPMPAPPMAKPLAVAVAVPPPEPTPAPEPEPAPQPAAAPPQPPAKVEEVSLLDFGNSPVAAAAPTDAWSAFDSAPGAPSSVQTSQDAFDPFGTFGSEAGLSTISDKSADPFNAPAASLHTTAPTTFDPFSNSGGHAAPTHQNIPTHTGSTFDPFSNPGAAAPASSAPAGFQDSAWAPFPAAQPAAPAAPQPAAAPQPVPSSDRGFGLDVFNGMPPAASHNSAPAPGSVNSSAEFNPFPASGPASQPAPATASANGNAKAKHAPAELPSDLFSDNAFSGPAFPAGPASQTFPNPMQPHGMMGPGTMAAAPMGGMFMPNGFGGPTAAGQAGMGPTPAAPQMGFGGPAANQFGGIRPAAAFPQPPAPFGGPGGQQFGANMMGAGPSAGMNQPGMNMQSGLGPSPWGGMGNSNGMTPANGAMGGFPPSGVNGPGQMGFGNQFNSMTPAGQMGGMGIGQIGSPPSQSGLHGFGGGMNGAPGFGGPQQGTGFNAFGPANGVTGGLPAPGAQFPGGNSFSMGPGAYGGHAGATTNPAAPKDDLAFADLVGDLKKALPTPSSTYGGGQAGFHAGTAAPPYGGAANGMMGGMGGGGGYGGFGGMPNLAPAAAPYGGSISSASGNPFA